MKTLFGSSVIVIEKQNMGASVLHIKTEVECKVFLFGEEKGIATLATYFNLEVRKGEQDLLFVSTADNSIRYSLLYFIKESDTDYRITIDKSMFHPITEVPDSEITNGIYDEDNVLYSRDGIYLIQCYNDDIENYVVKPTCKVICNYAFSGCNHLSAVILPEGLSHIGNMAFNDCWCLFRIYLPNSLEYIGNDAFCGCLLSHINLPISLTHIGRGAIDHRDIKIECTSPNFSFDKGCLVDTKEKRLIAYLSNVEIITLPSELISIGDEAFRNCEALSAVKLPEGLESIGKYAFSLCRKLSTINLPFGLKYIGDNAFEGCLSLTELHLPSSLIHIGNQAFFYCSNLTHINIPNSLKQIGDEAFAITGIKDVGCDSSQFLYVNGCLIDKKYMKVIACFSDASDVKLISGITRIGKSAFRGCKITSITIPQGVTHIDDSAFSECEELDNIVLPDSLISIGAKSFSGCDRLSDIKLPASLTSIGEWAFTFKVGISSSLRNRYLDLFEKNDVLEGESLDFEPISHIYIPKGTKTKFEQLLPNEFHSKLFETDY